MSNNNYENDSPFNISQSKEGSQTVSNFINNKSSTQSLEDIGWADRIEIPSGWTAEQVNKALWLNTSVHHAPACPHSRFWSEEDVLLESNATHLWIFHRAVDLLAQSTEPKYQVIAEFLAYQEKADENPADPAYPWPKNTIFHDALVKGLYDADHQNPWFNSLTWQSHFYDPVVNASYSTQTMSCNLPKDSMATNYAQKAYTMAYDFLSKAMDAYKNNSQANFQTYMIECFYYLGIVLHYFTDMTQPMHAHNYPNAVGGANDRFHEAFETAAQDYINTNPAALKIDFSSLTDDNCFSFGPTNGFGDPDVQAWVAASASKIGHPNFNLALTDVNGVPWALCPDAQGNDPLPPNIKQYQTIDHFYNFGSIGSGPAGYKTWQDACVPVFNKTLIAAQQATAGMLIQIFNNWMTGLLFEDGSGLGSPRSMSDFTPVPQNPVSIGCQTVYSYQGNKDQAFSIYTGKPDKYAQVIPYSSTHLPALGAYGLTVATNPAYPPAPNELLPAINTCAWHFYTVPRLGCPGAVIQNAVTSQGSSVVGLQGDLAKYPEGLVAEEDSNEASAS